MSDMAVSGERPSTAELLARLDPQRDYGERTFADVVQGVKSGAIFIEPGMNLPVLREAGTGYSIKGTGRPPVGTNLSAQQIALREFRTKAVDDIDEAYAELRKGMKSGDPRFHKIYWETLIGKVGELRGGEAMAEALKAVIQAVQQPQTRVIDVD